MGSLSDRRRGLDQATEVVEWSWSELDRALMDDATDPVACLPFVRAGTTTYYWELHFQRRRLTRVDFLHRAALLSSRPPGDEPAPDPPDPIVDRLASWRETSPAARRYCHPSAWLELDGPVVAGRGAREQGVSVCVDPSFGKPQSQDAVEGPCSEALIEMFSDLERACGVGTSRASVFAEAQHAIARAGGWVRHLSIMRGRAGRPAKIYAALPKDTFSRFLDEVSWPGDRASVSRLACEISAASDRVNVDLQIEDGLSERIGFEIFSDPSPVVDPLRSAATEHAVALGLISPREVEGLQRWVGNFRQAFGADRWPTIVQRWFDLKFVMLGADRLELKAYMGFRVCPGLFL